MTFDAVYSGIAGILTANGFQESLETTDFKDASTEEYGNTFILKRESGSAGSANDEQSAMLYDDQVWSVQLAFAQNAESSGEQLKELNRKIDILLTKLDDPSAWKSFATILRYDSWKVIETKSSFIVDIKLKVIDAFLY